MIMISALFESTILQSMLYLQCLFSLNCAHGCQVLLKSSGCNMPQP